MSFWKGVQRTIRQKVVQAMIVRLNELEQDGAGVESAIATTFVDFIDGKLSGYSDRFAEVQARREYIREGEAWGKRQREGK